MDTYYDEVMKVLPQDHAFLRSCATALATTDIPLTQQLLQLQDTIATHAKTMTEHQREEREGEVEKEGVGGAYNGIVDVDEVDGVGREGKRGRTAAAVNGDITMEGKGEVRREEVREEVDEEDMKGVKNEMRDEVGDKVREGVMEEEEVREEVGEEMKEEENGVGRSEAVLEVPFVAAGLEDEGLIADVVTSLPGVIQDSPEFPSGPTCIFSNSHPISGEPDLDSTLSRVEELDLDATLSHAEEPDLDAVLSRAEDNWSVSRPLETEGDNATSAVLVPQGEDVPEGNRSAGGGDVLGVARSQFKAIPQAIVGYTSNNLLLNNSTPNSLGGNSSVGDTPSGSIGGISSQGESVGGTPSMDSSVGGMSFGGIFLLGDSGHYVSLDPSASSLESQGGVDYQDKEATASRTRQMSLHMANSKEEDVIAVPVITRSSSTG